jgi:DNA-binding beta-propeller fold protein YncE
MPRRPLAVVLVVLAALGAGVLAVADEPSPDAVGPAVKTTVDGRRLAPFGRLVGLGNFPTGGAATPDGRFYWTVSTGRGRNDVRIVDVAGGAVVQTLPLPGASGGIAMDPSSPVAYVSGVPDSTHKDQASPSGTPGTGGDVVHVFRYDVGSGRATFDHVIPVPPPSTAAPAQDFPPAQTKRSWPDRLAVSANGATLLVPLNLADAAAIVDTRSGAVRTVATGGYPYGAAILPDGKTGLVSNETPGTVSVIDLKAGTKVKDITVGPHLSHPEAIALDPRGARAYVPLANSDQVAVIDTAKLTVTRMLSLERPEGLGTSPVDVAVTPDGGRLLVAQSGADALAVFRLPGGSGNGRPGAGAAPAGGSPGSVVTVRSTASILRYRARRLAARRALSRALKRTPAAAPRRTLQARYRKSLSALRRSLLFGTTRTACSGPSRQQELRYVRAVLLAAGRRASARRAVRGTSAKARRRRAAIDRTLRGRLALARGALPKIASCAAGGGGGAGGAPGSGPAVPDFGRIGAIPTASQPMAVTVTPSGQLLYVSAKGVGTGANPKGPQPDQPSDSDDGIGATQYLPLLVTGMAGVGPLPGDGEIAAMAPAADGAVRPANAQDAPADTPLRPDGPIKHVFFIVRENRTYDQVLGDDARGDGDPKLTLFGSHVTPNAHALVQRFPLLDHVFANSEASIDGHFWTSAGSVPDYVNKNWFQNYAARGRPYDFPVYAVAFPANGFLIDQATRQGISYYNYGEAIAGNIPLPDKDRTPAETQAVTAKFANSDIGIGAGACYPNDGSVGKDAITQQPVFDTLPPVGARPDSRSRFACFQTKFSAQLAAANVPTFNYMVLSNDHTRVLSAGAYTPRAMVADNDEALGRIVDLISHSSIWSSSAIFVVEDDSQDGADHVDAHRIPAMVISPYAKPGAVVHTRYDFASVLHSMELIMGMSPLGFHDALGVPMYDAFQATPNSDPYTLIPSNIDLLETNPASGPGAAASARLPTGLDAIPQHKLDALLWKSVHGWNATPPPPGPNASGER